MNQPDIKVEPPKKYLQEELLDNVSEEITLSKRYLWLIISSAIIAALGLIINSSAVVIGAMLISPLFWPILGLSLSIITSRKKLARRSSLNLIVSIALVIGISFLAGSLSPFPQINNEISSRTAPTLLDLCIALASSFIGVLAFYHPKISQSASGVAISIALLPALSVVGIGLAYGSLPVFLGSLLLFLTNMAAIIFTGAVTLYVLKFRPRHDAERSRWRLGIAISLISLALLSLPLTYILLETLEQRNKTIALSSQLESFAQQLDESAVVTDISIDFPQFIYNQPVQVEANLLIPESVKLTEQQQNQLLRQLESSTQRPVKLSLNLVNALVLANEQDEQAAQLQEQIRSELEAAFEAINNIDFIESISVRQRQNGQHQAQVRLVTQDNTFLSSSLKQQIQDQVSQSTGADLELIIEFVPITRLTDLSDRTQLRSETEAAFKEYLANNYPGVQVVTLEINIFDQPEISSTASQSAVLGIESARVKAILATNADQPLDENLVTDLEGLLSTVAQVPVSVQIEQLLTNSLVVDE